MKGSCSFEVYVVGMLTVLLAPFLLGESGAEGHKQINGSSFKTERGQIIFFWM